MTLVSIIVPAYNEEENIALINAEILPVARRLDAELILVDDGSEDKTALLGLRIQGVRVVRISRAGKSAALLAGIKAAHGEIVVTIDADVQEDPTLADVLVRDVRDGATMSMGIRVPRADPLFAKRIPSRIYRALIAILFGRRFRDIDCGFRAFRRDTALKLFWFEGMHRLLPLFVVLAGGTVVERPVLHRERRFGRSKYMSPTRFYPAMGDLLKARFRTLVDDQSPI